jgi:DNA transposition AAA+ family ATPase
MPPISPENKTALELSLPPVETTIASVRDYIALAGMSQGQFATVVGRSRTAITAFLGGNYGKRQSDLNLRRRLEDFMRRNPVGVAPTESSGRMYGTENVAQIRAVFDQCHRYDELMFIYGPPGSQKTFVLEHLVAEFNRSQMASEDSRAQAYFMSAFVGIRPRDMMAEICRAVGAYGSNTLRGCLLSLHQRLRGRKVILVLDEMQHCGIDTLEAVRKLFDMLPELGILIAGSHRLKQLFDTRAVELEQWNSRLDNAVELSGVSEACARAILAAEIPELDDELTGEWIAAATVRDIYSRDANKTYLSVRRLFKSIKTYRRLAEAEGVTV